jgi:hypothetical protein
LALTKLEIRLLDHIVRDRGMRRAGISLAKYLTKIARLAATSLAPTTYHLQVL